MDKIRRADHWHRNDSGASAVEFAMIAPLMCILLMGILCYGGYFWTAHSVQQMANDGARAAVSGITAAERKSLAESVVADQITTYPTMIPAAAKVVVTEDNERVEVKLSYNAEGSPFFVLGKLAPMPSTMIIRQAAVRLGGY